MARRPSLINRALSTPPATPTTISPENVRHDHIRPSEDVLTPPTSPTQSKSSSNLQGQTVGLSQPGWERKASINPPNSFPTESRRDQQYQHVDGVRLCPFDVHVVRDRQGQDQVFGFGAWSMVLKGTASHRQIAPASSFGLVTPPSSPKAMAPLIVAVKRPARSDARAVLQSEAKILTHLSATYGWEHRIVEFFGVMTDGTALVMAAVSLSLEYHINRCSSMARRNLTTQTMFQPVLGSSKIWLHLAHSLISGLCWLHDEAAVIHGDIKPGNFLLQPKVMSSDDDFPYQPLFIDFSSSHLIDSAEVRLNTLSAVTREYTAPELLVSSVLRDPKATATRASDVFSLAVTLLVAATGETMVYPGSVFQRQAMATQGWQVLSFVRSGDSGARVPRHGVVEKVLERAVLKADMGRIWTGRWLELVEDVMMGEPQKNVTLVV